MTSLTQTAVGWLPRLPPLRGLPQWTRLRASGAEGAHSFVTGKLVYVGKMKPEIKLQTPEGDKTFPLVRQDIKTGGIEEGTLVTAELNEAGAVIDLHRAKK